MVTLGTSSCELMLGNNVTCRFVTRQGSSHIVLRGQATFNLSFDGNGNIVFLATRCVTFWAVETIREDLSLPVI